MSDIEEKSQTIEGRESSPTEMIRKLTRFEGPGEVS